MLISYLIQKSHPIIIEFFNKQNLFNKQTRDTDARGFEIFKTKPKTNVMKPVTQHANL